MKKYKIVTDSSSDVFSFEGLPFACAPLKIITSQKEYVDDGKLNTEEMVEDLLNYNGKSSTSCPNPQDWISAFGDAERVFCVTITGTLSGSYSSALIAKELYESEYPDRRVFVINSLSAGPELRLIIEKLGELILSGEKFAAVCEKITDYIKNTGLIFMLESMKNLVNNGRVSHLKAKAVGLLGLRIVGKASDKGDLQPLATCRGQEKALIEIVKRLKEYGLEKGKVRIAHCLNEGAAFKLKELILKELEKAKIEVYKCGGLCSFYAEKGGLLVGFEKF